MAGCLNTLMVNSNYCLNAKVMKALSIITRFRGVALNHRVKLYLQQHCLNLASDISNQLVRGNW
jgi:hypothetical protein